MHGICIGANQCNCTNGWSGLFCNQPTCDGVNRCSNHGWCIAENSCQCYDGWKSNDCSMFECRQNCANGGLCIGANTCSCTLDWQGQFCTIPICKGNCNNHGTCIFSGTCQCYPQYTGNNCTACANHTWSADCKPCPSCKNGKCDRNNGTCICQSHNWTGELCDQCSAKFYGENCLPLPKIANLIPNYSPDTGNVLITVVTYNLNRSLSYKCVFGSIEVNASLLNGNTTDSQLSCLSPVLDTGLITFSLMSGNFLFQYDGVFSVIGACPLSGCGENDTIKRGYCRLGKCECILPYSGNDCTSVMVAPKFVSVKDVFVYQFDSISIPIQVSSGSQPVFINVLQAPETIVFQNNSLLTWSNITSTVSYIEIKLQASNKIGSDYLTVKITIKPIYVVVIDALTKTSFNKAEAVVVTGTLRLKNDTSVAFNQIASVNIKIKGIYNNEVNVKLNSKSDGSFFYRYNPSSPYEYGIYSVDAKNDLDTTTFNPQITWTFLGI